MKLSSPRSTRPRHERFALLPTAAAESCFIFPRNLGGNSREAISGSASKGRRSRPIWSGLSHTSYSQSVPDRLRIWLAEFSCLSVIREELDSWRAESESFPLCQHALRLAGISCFGVTPDLVCSLNQSNRLLTESIPAGGTRFYTNLHWLYISLGDRDETSDLCSLCCAWI